MTSCSYYSAWQQAGHMIIQNEYCDGGSLADKIAANQKISCFFSEQDILTITLHVARGLAAMHAQGIPSSCART